MNYQRLALAVLASAAMVSGAGAQMAPMKAKADIKGDGILGTATFREIDATGGNADPKFDIGAKEVEITIDVSGLKPGAHGVHLHAVGKCEGPTFASAGGHFDPGPNGNMDPDAGHPYHMGDLPNLVADAKGRARMTTITSRVTLAPGPLSLFDEDGTAIIVHESPDEGITADHGAGKSGGKRLACGVVVKQ